MERYRRAATDGGVERVAFDIADPSAANLLQVILHGTEPSSLPGRSAPMPAFASLNDGEIADLVNFIRRYVGSNGSEIVAKDVADAREHKH